MTSFSFVEANQASNAPFADQLIDMLSANLEPVNAGWLGKTLVLAILAGGTGVAVLMLATVQDLCRTRADLADVPRNFSASRTRWRRGWDSNPRATSAAAGFQVRYCP